MERMSGHEKRKMSFIPIVRRGSGDGEDLLNREMDEIFQTSSSTDSTARRPDIIGRRLPEEERKSFTFDDDDLKGCELHFQLEVLEEDDNEEAEAENRDAQKANATELLKSGEAVKAIMSDILEEFSDDEPQDDFNLLNQLSPNSKIDSNISINISDGLEARFDHTPHELFIQLNELHGSGEFQEWRETARWVKYEENVEEGADRWGRPHVSSLSFHSLLNVRRCLETGVILMDLEEKDLANIVYRTVETMFIDGMIRVDDREKIFKTLLLHHNCDHHHGVFNFGMRKRGSSQSLRSNKSIRSFIDSRRTSNIMSRRQSGNIKQYSRRGSTAVFHPGRSGSQSPKKRGSFAKNGIDVKMVLEHDEEQIIQNEYLLKRLPPKCEGVAVLTGLASFLEQPTIAFIRLSEGMKIPYMLEVAVPVRFIFILLGPKLEDIDYHEVGRSISALMSNKQFHSKVYKAKIRKDLVVAMNDFLDGSIVLPPGKFDKEALLPFDELKEKADMIRMRKRRAICHNLKSNEQLLSPEQLKLLNEMYEKGQRKPNGPLKKTGRLWGGLMNDLKRRLPMFKSDVIDGLNFETLAATVFLYFACFATAITFGGLAGDLTRGNIGISETLLGCSMVGVIFHTFCGQPLVIIGTTGPLILFDKALVGFCDSQGYNFLNVRVYVGFWMIIISVIVSAFEGSTYVRLFTRFTQEIFSALITLIYLYSTFNKTISVYKKNPLMEISDYTAIFNGTDEVTTKAVVNQPNTALFCTLLTLGTFVFAYNLKIFRNSKFLGRTTRRALGDFGVPISIAIFVVIANALSQVETEKLKVPDGIEPTLNRPWLVPLWIDGSPIWLPLMCIVPGFLVYILAFMETHISELILDKPERKLKKGCGFHWDIVLLCFLNAICGLLGMPWHCAATVRSVAHISAVTVMSTNHPPGESPHIIGVKEQRLSGFFVALLIGLSIFAAPILKKIPISVLFGVFLYMGICSMNGVQFFERIVLFFKPVKYHTGVYATKVLTYRMHFFTIVQILALAILWTVNESAISLAFPFFLIMMVPLRKIFEIFYSPSELEALDGAQQNDNDDIDYDDFYEQTCWPA